MPPLVELHDVSKDYGPIRALGPLTLSLPDASVGLLGPNGAGKSTLIRLLLGMVPPTSGTIQVLGEEVQPGNKALRGKIGYAPEGDAMFPDLNGVEAVSYAGRLVGMRKLDALQRAHQVLDYVGVGEERYRKAEGYSTGMKQRLKLAQALVHDPQLLILDEPTEGVDPQARLQILDFIRELEREHGVRILVSTHLLHDVERAVDQVLVLNEGRAVVQGPLADLRRKAAAGYVVRVTGPAQAFAEKLREAGLQSHVLEPQLRVDTDNPRRILQLAEEAGVVVRHLAPAELTMEEVFEEALKVTPHA
jgi:ABC-2 type transport system ATP-binding protein